MPTTNSSDERRIEIAQLKRHAPRINPGSPVAEMVEQAKRYAATLPELGDETHWQPPKL